MTKEELRQQFFEATGTHWSTKPLDYSEWLEQRLLLSSEAEKGEKWDRVYIVRDFYEHTILGCYADRQQAEQSAKDMLGKNYVTIHVVHPSPPSPQEKQGVEESNKQQ